MAASTANRYDMAQVDVKVLELPVSAGIHLFKNTHACVNTSTGGLVPAADTANLVYMGQVVREVDNTAGNLGTLLAPLQPKREIRYARFYAVSPAATWIGKVVFFTDDVTVAITSTNSVRAGRCVRIDDSSSTGSVVVDVADAGA